MAWIPFFYLGPSNNLIRFQFPMIDLRVARKAVEFLTQNLRGDEKRTIIHIDKPEISITGRPVSHADFNLLNSLYFKTKSLLEFLVRDSASPGLWEVSGDESTSTSTTKVKITPTSARGITITGVFLSTDPLNTGVNFFTGGTFSESTGEITLGVALASANTEVLINYKFSRYKVRFMGAPEGRAMRGTFKNHYDVSFRLVGA